MRKFLRFAAVATSLTALVGVGVAGPAGATPPTGYGFDNTAHAIVGGGSDTTYNAMNAITKLWDASLGCPTNTGDVASPVANTCVANGGAETDTLGNYQHDTVVQAFPTGSSTGIGTLNAFPNGVSYAGTVNGSPVTPDFARSSREPVTASPFTSTKCNPGGVASSELQCDTFWGFAEDGIEVMGFNSTNAALTQRGTELSNDSTGLTDAEIFNIWNCTYTTWSQVPSLGITSGSAQDGPIVVWGMNSASGTYGTFNSYVIAHGGAPTTFTVDANTACDRKLTPTAGNIFPFENDIKPIMNDVQNNGTVATGNTGATTAGITTGQNDVNNPANWIWFGSGGVLNSYPYTSSYAPAGTGTTVYTAVASSIDGTGYGTGNVSNLSYPIDRTLYHVTRKADADCAADTAGFNRPCDFSGNPGPAYPAHDGQAAGTDLNVTGGTSGISGAVREFTRFLCRQGQGQQTKDTLTGTNLFTEIGSAISADGFTRVPSSLRTAGSSCHVES